jgi:hypothetical protein
MDILLEDRVSLSLLELSLEVLEASSVGGAIGATARIGQVEAFVLDLFAVDAPGSC